MTNPSESLPDAKVQMGQVNQQIHHYQRAIRLSIENYLHDLAGKTFGSVEENQAFTREVQQWLESHGLRVRCPECGHPAILRTSKSGNSAGGLFVFDHYIDGRRTFHGGGSTIPKVRLIAKPPRRPRAAAS
ncbi:hypothetical protein FF011L_55220 [Roseimaritima multifibrata]|uniref:Transposase n=1 Tax=Roseimaritima multifibrata TaxID=1930274 RepID=A0A517MPA7_9BACT|nr:hypothetical protein [Roseimaritima multifibrata]QDS96710.1 hypothetical protein FF011L_55220 [Roseimaritima multifibrata]